MEDYDNAFADSLSGNEIVVLDNYYFSTNYQNRIREKGCKLVCIDDMHDRYMVADVVFTFCPLEREDFSLEPYTQFYGGIEWSFLRPPFLNGNISRKDDKRINSLVLAVGGSDPYKLTDKLISLIKSVDKNIRLSVIAGDTVNISPELLDNIDLYRRLSADEIVTLFSNSDLGIFPASTFCIEAISQKLPVAAGWYVDNQKDFYRIGAENRWFFPLGNFFDDSDVMKKKLETVIKSSVFPSVVDINFIQQREKIRYIFRNL